MNRMFLITYVIWMFSEIWLNRMMRSNKSDLQDSDRFTLLGIWLTIVTSIFLAVWASFGLNHLISGNAWLQYVGLVLVWSGVIARMLVIRSMGRFFTVDVTIRPDHKLKTDGFFRFVRHPSYLASLVSFLGFGISLNNWFSLAIVVVPVFCAFLIRIGVEERVLLEQFGAAYSDYQGKTKRIIPFVF